MLDTHMSNITHLYMYTIDTEFQMEKMKQETRAENI